MPRTKTVSRGNVEPKFFGIACKGPNPEGANSARDSARMYETLAKFYELPREDQLAVAAVATELERQNNNGI